MPFDSYSPLTPGRRGIGVGGNQLLEDFTYYGCCACIGSVGAGIYTSHRLLWDKDGITLSFFDDGTDIVKLGEGEAKVSVSGGYPKNGSVKIKLSYENVEKGVFKVRLPAWSKNAEIITDIPYLINNGYAVFSPRYDKGNEISLKLDMTLREIYPESWTEDTVYTDMTGSSGGWHFAKARKIYHSPEFDDYICLARGPVTLAADSAMGKRADSVFSFVKDGEGIRNELLDSKEEIVKLKFTSEDGKPFTLIDYSSAGKDWKTTIAAWLPTK
jgi:hypothetical protein